MPSIINATTTGGVVVSGDNSGSLQLASNNGTTAVTIDGSQNVGIGTTSPSVKFHVDGTGNQYSRLSSSTNANFVQLFCLSGSTGVEYKSVYRLVDTDVGERMRIDSNGRVLVNKTASDLGCQMEVKGINSFGAEITTVTGTGLQVTYTPSSGLVYWANFTYNGSNMGSITSSGSSTAYNTGSDYRLKENIASMTGALAKVAQLKPSTWTWKRNGSDGQGFIAHELAEVCPDAVVGEKDAVDEEGNPQYQGVDTSFLVATLTAAIQELNAKVEAQAVRIAELEGAQ